MTIISSPSRGKVVPLQAVIDSEAQSGCRVDRWIDDYW